MKAQIGGSPQVVPEWWSGGGEGCVHGDGDGRSLGAGVGLGGMCVGIGNGWGSGMHACGCLTICTRLAMQEPRSGPCSSTLGTPGCRGESR